MDVLHTSRFRVANHEVGPNGELRLSSLMNQMQQAAGEHAATWGLSVPDLLPRKLTWVLTRYHMRLVRSPRLRETIEITTWPSGRASTFATRDFEIRDADGAPVAVASTSWAMLELEGKTVVRLDEVVPAEFRLDRRALETVFPALPKLEPAEVEVPLPVMLRDLDMNAHVNHVVYAQWALETLPLELLRERTLSEVEIAYRAEAHCGDRIVSRRGPGVEQDGARGFLHQIVNVETGVDHARLRTRWRERGATSRNDAR